MDITASQGLIAHFSKLDDPRVDRNNSHELIDVIALCARGGQWRRRMERHRGVRSYEAEATVASSVCSAAAAQRASAVTVPPFMRLALRAGRAAAPLSA